MHLRVTHRAVFVGFQVAYNAGFADLGYGMEREESQVLVRADTPSPFHFVPIAKVCPKAQQNRDVCFAHLAPASYTSPGAGGSCVSVFRDSWWNLMKVQNEPQDSKPRVQECQRRASPQGSAPVPECKQRYLHLQGVGFKPQTFRAAGPQPRYPFLADPGGTPSFLPTAVS